MMNNIDFIMNQILSQKNIKEEKRTPEFLLCSKEEKIINLFC